MRRRTMVPVWMSDDELDSYVEEQLVATGSEFDLQYWREFIDGPDVGNSWLEQGQEFLSVLDITVVDVRDDDTGDMLEWLVTRLPGWDV